MNALVIVLPISEQIVPEYLSDVLDLLPVRLVTQASLVGVVNSDTPDLIEILKDRRGETPHLDLIRTALELHISALK